MQDTTTILEYVIMLVLALGATAAGFTAVRYNASENGPVLRYRYHATS